MYRHLLNETDQTVGRVCRS